MKSCLWHELGYVQEKKGLRPILLSQETVPGILAFEQGLMESLVFTVNLWGVTYGRGWRAPSGLFI